MELGDFFYSTTKSINHIHKLTVQHVEAQKTGVTYPMTDNIFTCIFLKINILFRFHDCGLGFFLRWRPIQPCGWILSKIFAMVDHNLLASDWIHASSQPRKWYSILVYVSSVSFESYLYSVILLCTYIYDLIGCIWYFTVTIMTQCRRHFDSVCWPFCFSLMWWHANVSLFNCCKMSDWTLRLKDVKRTFCNVIIFCNQGMSVCVIGLCIICEIEMSQLCLTSVNLNEVTHYIYIYIRANLTGLFILLSVMIHTPHIDKLSKNWWV